MSFRIVNESILDQKVDAIVNPANSFLKHDGGLARIIHESASEPLEGTNPFRPGWYEEDLMQLRKTPVPTGGAVVQKTTGPLPFKAIIHAVGPIWGGGQYCEYSLLLSAYTRAILLAIDEGYTSIALPAISMGIFGVPRDVVAFAACHTARRFEHQIDITLCLTSDEDVAAFEEYR